MKFMRAVLTMVIFACMVFIVSCDIRSIPLKNTYQDQPYQFSVSHRKEQVWSKLIDIFTAKGLAIKIIDEKSGLITTENISFLNSFAWEKKDGSLTNPAAFVVCSKVRGPFTFPASLHPSSLSGQWVVRTKQEPDKTIVDIKLANASGIYGSESLGSFGQTPVSEIRNLSVASTGVFEKAVAEALK